MKLTLKTKPQPLDEDRVNALRDEIDAFIDERVEQQSKKCPGVPKLVIRNILTARSLDCQCKAYLALKQLDEA